MEGRIRIIKRGAPHVINPISANPIAKSDRQRERETVNTVKGWIADWEARKRSLQEAAATILCSIGDRSEVATKRLARVN
jgi:hypothetical protein